MAKNWKERREEEARILAEMQDAMKEQAQKKEGEKNGQEEGGTPPKETREKYHCSKCGNFMQDNGVCPACGHRIYVPMEESKQKTAQTIIGVVCIVVFLLIYFIFAK